MAKHRKLRHPAIPGNVTGKMPEEGFSKDLRTIRARIGFTVGLAGTVFGVLAAVGFPLLPAATIPEKLCIVITCGALSVASISSLGAWASTQRLCTTLAAMSLAVLCMAALAVAAHADRPATSQEPLLHRPSAALQLMPPRGLYPGPQVNPEHLRGIPDRSHRHDSPCKPHQRHQHATWHFLDPAYVRPKASQPAWPRPLMVSRPRSGDVPQDSLHSVYEWVAVGGGVAHESEFDVGHDGQHRGVVDGGHPDFDVDGEERGDP